MRQEPRRADLTARLLRALATIKAGATPGTAAGMQLPRSEAPVLKDLGNGLAAAYVVDEGDRFTYVQNWELEASDFIIEGLHESSVSNLGRRCEGKARVEQHGPIHGMFFDGMFEASLILVEPLWDVHLAHLAPNGFVATLPSRDVFAFCDAKSAEGIATLRDMAARVTATGDHLLTPQLYARRDGEWVPYA